jgi:hypothetical protein
MSTANMRWTANMYEYAIDVWGKELPHVIMLSKQSCLGYNGTIMHGELAQLVTAMRNRAFEPEEKAIDNNQEFKDDQEEQKARFPEGKNSSHVFAFEQRFPVRSLLKSFTESLTETFVGSDGICGWSPAWPYFLRLHGRP